jgi:NAD+ diphosphatase
MDFVSRTIPPEGGQTPAYWFVFQDDRLLMRQAGDRAEVPRATDIAELGLTSVRALYLGHLHDDAGKQVDCYCAEIAPDAPIPSGMMADGLRQLYTHLGDQFFALAGRAVQIVAWDRTHHFCGQCGGVTERLESERGRHCPRCGLTSYPRIAPAIIIAVVREDGPQRQILLARNHRFPTGRYSVLAGYAEPGESLEECAHREVHEEVGITIVGLRYFGSQPWPFPHSLMIGFTAIYAGGEITLEESELADAQWFAVDALPDLPPRMTIARRLIDWFVSTA